jgi:hypothetical protein
VSAGRALAGLVVAAAATGLGCATCRPEAPPVRTSVGGAIGGGSGGFYHSTGVGFDVTNLFCRAPQPSQPDASAQPAQTPVPGTPPIPDAPKADAPPSEAAPANDSQR